MAASTSGTVALKEYLKRYESNTEVDKKKRKRKKKPRPDSGGVLVVDEDPVWQKPVNLEEEENDDTEEVPQVDEDIEVKRLKRLEQIQSRRPYNSISEDGSGWVSLSPKHSNLNEEMPYSSPPRRQRIRNDTPSPEPETRPVRGNDSLSSSQLRQRIQDNPSPERGADARHSSVPRSDLSPPRRKNKASGGFDGPKGDISPPRRRRVREDTPSPETKRNFVDPGKEDDDLSPPHQRRKNFEMSETDLSPPRRHSRSQNLDSSTHASRSSDLSPPRRCRKGSENQSSSARAALQRSAEIDAAPDLSPPRKSRKDLSVPSDSKVQPIRGLVSGQDTSKEIARTKKEDLLRFQAMDPSMTGRDATPVFRDKRTGRRLEKDEMVKQEEEKPKEKKLEWGKGLAQKREAEERLRELELEKEKPFAQTRDDPELDKMLKDRVRWGDPMAHLVKKNTEAVVHNFGENEKMKESGFIIPQDIPSHSWLKRGVDSAPNRYGIKPGRHWDGVDRSNGSEKGLFKRMNEKQATEREAYLWSVSDM